MHYRCVRNWVAVPYVVVSAWYGCNIDLLLSASKEQTLLITKRLHAPSQDSRHVQWITKGSSESVGTPLRQQQNNGKETTCRSCHFGGFLGGSPRTPIANHTRTGSDEASLQQERMKNGSFKTQLCPELWGTFHLCPSRACKDTSVQLDSERILIEESGVR
eukprot:5123810-Amphidinium_carterae.1